MPGTSGDLSAFLTEFVRFLVPVQRVYIIVSMWKIKQIYCFYVFLNSWIPLYMHIYLWNNQGDVCHTFKFLLSKFLKSQLCFHFLFQVFQLAVLVQVPLWDLPKVDDAKFSFPCIASLGAASKTPNNESVNWCNLPWSWLTFQGLKRQPRIEGSKPAWIPSVNTLSMLQITWCFTLMWATEPTLLRSSLLVC